MTARDRTVVMVLVVVGAMAAFWFGVLAPKRNDANRLAGEIRTSRADLASAQASVQAAVAAQRGYASDYATVARLGKAVPELDDVPSLVYQLQSAAHGAKVSFDSIAVSNNAGAGAAAVAPATPAAQVAALGKEQKGQDSGAAAVPATQAAASVLPPGAAVGAAGFPTMPFDFSFQGTYFRLQDFFSELNKFTDAGAGSSKLNVRGRLLTVDGLALSGFPNLTATIHATAYLLPDDQGLTAGATPAGPGAAATPAASSTPSPSTPAAPAAAVVTGVGR